VPVGRDDVRGHRSARAPGGPDVGAGARLSLVWPMAVQVVTIKPWAYRAYRHDYGLVSARNYNVVDCIQT
jgi:hypothetical protein